MEKTFHERCYFVSKGEPCIDIIDANDKYNYDDYQGWKGLVAYCTKKMYNPDMMLEVFDNQNSTLTIKRYAAMPTLSPEKPQERRSESYQYQKETDHWKIRLNRSQMENRLSWSRAVFHGIRGIRQIEKEDPEP